MSLNVTNEPNLDAIFAGVEAEATKELAVVEKTNSDLVPVQPLTQSDIDKNLRDLLDQSNDILYKASQIVGGAGAASPEVVSGAASLISSVKGVIGELNKSVMMKQKFEFQLELEKLKIQAKLELQKLKNDAKKVEVKGDNTTVNNNTMIFRPEDALKMIREAQKAKAVEPIDINIK